MIERSYYYFKVRQEVGSKFEEIDEEDKEELRESVLEKKNRKKKNPNTEWNRSYYKEQDINEMQIEEEYRQQFHFEEWRKGVPSPPQHFAKLLIEKYLIIAMIMGLKQLPYYRLHWADSTKSLLGTTYETKIIKKLLTRDNFEEIHRYIHYEQQFLEEFCNSQCENQYFFTPENVLAIDEIMLGTRCRTPILQYMPAKPDKIGIKLYAYNSYSGYVRSYYVFRGKQTHVSNHPDEIVKYFLPHISKIDFHFGEKASNEVLQTQKHDDPFESIATLNSTPRILASVNPSTTQESSSPSNKANSDEKNPENRDIEVYLMFDNFYTSLSLAKSMIKEFPKINFVGNCRVDRPHKLFDILTLEIKKKGDISYRYHKEKPLLAYGIFDSKKTYFLTNRSNSFFFFRFCPKF